MSATGHLGDHIEAYVSALVESGRYRSRSDVLRDGVRLLEERESHLAVLDEALKIGLDDAGAGRVETLEMAAQRIAKRWKHKPSTA